MKLSQWNIWQRSAAVSALVAVAGAWSPAHATNFFVGVNPQTGQTLFGVRSGAAPTVPGANQPGQYIYPIQQINLPQGGEASAGNQLPKLLTQDEMMVMLSGSSPEVMDAILKNVQAIRDENNALLRGSSNAGQGNANYDENVAKMIDALLQEMMDSGLLTPEQRARVQLGSSAVPPSGTARSLSPEQQAALEAKKKELEQIAAQRQAQQAQQTQAEADKKRAELLARQQQLRSNNPVPPSGDTPPLQNLPSVPDINHINQMGDLMDQMALLGGGAAPLPPTGEPSVPLGDNGPLGNNPVDMSQLQLNQLVNDSAFPVGQNPVEPPGPVEEGCQYGCS